MLASENVSILMVLSPAGTNSATAVGREEGPVVNPSWRDDSGPAVAAAVGSTAGGIEAIAGGATTGRGCEEVGATTGGAEGIVGTGSGVVDVITGMTAAGAETTGAVAETTGAITAGGITAGAEAMGTGADGEAELGIAIGAVISAPLGGGLVSTRRLPGGRTTGAVGGRITVARVVLGNGTPGITGRAPMGNAFAGQSHAQLQAPFSIRPVPSVIPSAIY